MENINTEKNFFGLQITTAQRVGRRPPLSRETSLGFLQVPLKCTHSKSSFLFIFQVPASKTISSFGVLFQARRDGLAMTVSDSSRKTRAEGRGAVEETQPLPGSGGPGPGQAPEVQGWRMARQSSWNETGNAAKLLAKGTSFTFIFVDDNGIRLPAPNRIESNSRTCLKSALTYAYGKYSRFKLDALFMIRKFQETTTEFSPHVSPSSAKYNKMSCFCKFAAGILIWWQRLFLAIFTQLCHDLLTNKKRQLDIHVYVLH